jgi:hypothetical protein
MNTTPALVPVDQVERMAIAVAKSGLFGVKTPDQAMALMLIAQAEGLHPAIAARDYHVINGRPTLKADAMLARFQTAGGSVRWGEYTDRRVVGTFSHPQGGSVEVAWTVDMANAAGLTKNPTWKSYPRQMLRARCVSEGIRTVFPGVVVGTYTPEEAEDEPARYAPQPAAELEPVVEVLSFAEVMRRIDAARTVDDLNALKPAIRELDRDGRVEATDAARERAAQIRAGATETAQEAADDPV